MHKYKKDEVLVINTENKLLPFASQKNFRNAMIRSYRTVTRKDSSGKPILDANGKPIVDFGFLEAFEHGVNNPQIKCIVIESFTRLCELIEIYAEKVLGKTGYDFWGYYLDELTRILLTISSNCPKPIIWTALPEILVDENGSRVERVAVSGKLKNKVESYFECVVWADVDGKAKDASDRFRFMLRSNGKNSAKVPFELYPSDKVFMPNDVNMLLNDIRTMYGIDPNDPDAHYPKIMICGTSGFGKSTSLRNLAEATDVTSESK